jgi:Na+-transporting methylmalonyl-CoA/oxaloacetate decarboxylase gamma subunit
MGVIFIDLKRQIYFMQQMGYLISAKKKEDYEYKKEFPSLNMLC